MCPCVVFGIEIGLPVGLYTSSGHNWKAGGNEAVCCNWVDLAGVDVIITHADDTGPA